MRKRIQVPANASHLVVHVAIDNGVEVFLNGHDVSGGLNFSSGCGARDNLGPYTVPDSFVNRTGPNVLAVLARDDGLAFSFLDVSVDARLITGPAVEVPNSVGFADQSVDTTSAKQTVTCTTRARRR